MATYVINNKPMPIDFECNHDEVARILQNCKNLLMCKRGEVPYDRSRGLDPSIFDKPLADIEEDLLPEIDRLLIYEPGAEAVSATVEMAENGDTIITVVVEINMEEGDNDG